MTAPVVTALRARGRGRVAVELDGRAVAHRAARGGRTRPGSPSARPLDRPSARALGRELRRLEARERPRCGRCGPVTTRPRRSSGGSPSRDAAPPCGARRSRRRSAPDSSTTGASRAAGRAARRPRRGRPADRGRPRAQGVPAELAGVAIDGARAGIGPCRSDRRGAGQERANGALPGREGVLRGDPRADRCRSGRRRVRIEEASSDISPAQSAFPKTGTR